MSEKDAETKDAEVKSPPKHSWTKADRDAAYEACVILRGSLIHLPPDRDSGFEGQALNTCQAALQDLRDVMQRGGRPADSTATLIEVLCNHVLRPFSYVWERKRRTIERRGSDSSEIRARFYQELGAVCAKVDFALIELHRIAAPTPAVEPRTSQVIAILEGKDDEDDEGDDG